MACNSSVRPRSMPAWQILSALRSMPALLCPCGRHLNRTRAPVRQLVRWPATKFHHLTTLDRSGRALRSSNFRRISSSELLVSARPQGESGQSPELRPLVHEWHQPARPQLHGWHPVEIQNLAGKFLRVDHHALPGCPGLDRTVG